MYSINSNKKSSQANQKKVKGVTEIATNNAMPRGSMLLIKLLLYMLCYILLYIIPLKCLKNTPRKENQRQNYTVETQFKKKKKKS